MWASLRQLITAIVTGGDGVWFVKTS